MTKRLHHVIINRKKWVNGSNSTDSSLGIYDQGKEAYQKGYKGDSQLLNDEGNMCCLGFFAKSCGIKPRDIRGVNDPSDFVDVQMIADRIVNDMWAEDNPKVKKQLARNKSKVGSSLYSKLLTKNGNNNALCTSLIQTNDNADITNKEREQTIKKKLRSIGVLVKFEG